MINRYANCYKIFIGGFILILCSSFLLYKFPVLLLSDVKRDTNLALPMWKQTGFTLEYTHSVNKSQVQEHFVFAPDNQIVLTSTNFQSLGVGTPFLPEEGTLINNEGVFSLTDINRRLDFLTIGFMPIAKQFIIVDDNVYWLEDYFESGAFINVSYKKMVPLQFIVQEWLGGKKVLYE